MNAKHTTPTAILGVLLLALAGVPLANAQRFTFTAVDVPNALSGGVANDGEAVGFYFDKAGTAHGFLRLPDGTLRLRIDASATAVGTFLHRIDSQGKNVAGHWIDSAGLQHGLVIELSTNTLHSFDFLSPAGVVGTIVDVNGINTSGEVSGGYQDSSRNEHGFTANLGCLNQTTCYETVDFPGALQTELQNVNDGGDLVGVYLSDKGHLVSFLLSGGTFTTLSSPSGAAVIARGINNLQEIVGFDENSIAFFASLTGVSNGLFKTPGSSHGFFLSSPTARAIPVDFPVADAQQDGVGSINDSRMIAGQYNSPGFVTHGFVAVPTN